MIKPFLIAILLATAGSAGAGARALAHISPAETNVFLGQVFTVDVIVSGSLKPAAADLRAVADDFHVTLLDDGLPTGTTNTWLFRYAFRAKREGSLTIPSLRYGDAASESLTITARQPERTDKMALELQLSETSVYVGQPVLLTTRWESTIPFTTLKSVDFYFPLMSDQRFRMLDPVEPLQDSPSEKTGLPVHGTRVLAVRQNYSEGGTPHQSLTFNKVLIPQTAGLIRIPPGTLLCAARKKDGNERNAFQYPAYFDNTFFDKNVRAEHYERLYTASAPLVLNVNPLPQQGRPDAFYGLVGSFSITVSAEPVEVRVGDPIMLTITVSSADFAEAITLPPLRSQDKLLLDFEVPADRAQPMRSGRSKIYTQTVRPRSTDVDQIPPIELSFFNPATKSYETITSKAIPVLVSEAEAIGVYGLETEEAPTAAARKPIRWPRWTPAAGAVILLLAAAAGILRLASCFWKRHIQQALRQWLAFPLFRLSVCRLLRHSMKRDIYGGLDMKLRTYLGRRLGLKPGILTFRDAEKKLVKIDTDPAIVEELKCLFEVCEAYRFTREFDESTNARTIVQTAIDMARRVEQSQKANPTL